MRLHRILKVLAGIVLLGGVVTAGILTRAAWLPWVLPSPAPGKAEDKHAPAGELQQVKLTLQAQSNLRLVAKPLKADIFWRTIPLPGMIVDRPAYSDRGIVSPVTAVVTKVHHFPGDTVRPGDLLFTLLLLSESLHLTQSELFKTTQEIQITEEQKKRLADPATQGVIPQARIIELDNQLRRLAVAAQAYRQELQTRGLNKDQIDGVAQGKYASKIEVKSPQQSSPDDADLAFEVQELKVELGQQVQAGQTLCLLSNHQLLYIEGRAFRQETPLLERAAREGWPVKVEFMEDKADDQEFVFLGVSTVGLMATPFGQGSVLVASALHPGRNGRPSLEQSFRIRHIANTIDTASRTFAFFLPLTNQSRSFEKDGRTLLLWRFRPGQKVRLHVRVEKFENVFVLPADAVVREGPEAYVFRQNGDFFDRKPVRVVYQDRQHVVIANDGSVPPGLFVAQNGATQLNRVLKAQSRSTPGGFHVHPDGSVHSNY